MRFSERELHIGGSCAVTVSKAELSSKMLSIQDLESSVMWLAFTVPISVVSYTIGTNSKQQPLTLEKPTVSNHLLASSVTPQAHVQFLGIKTFTPIAQFANKVTLQINDLFMVGWRCRRVEAQVAHHQVERLPLQKRRHRRSL